MAGSSYYDVWKRLSNISLPWCGQVQPLDGHTAPQTICSAGIPPLGLHIPTDYADFLYDLQLPTVTIEKSLNRIFEAVEEQKGLHEEKYRELCGQLSQLNAPSTSSNPMAHYERIKRTHQKSFDRHLLRIRASFLEALEKLRASLPPTKTSFRQVRCLLIAPLAHCVQALNLGVHPGS